MCFAISHLLCGDGGKGYTIFYEEELLEALPEDTRNRETLEAVLKTLLGGGYIEVKYARGNAFCIKSVREFAPPPKKTETPQEAVIYDCPPNMPRLPRFFYLKVCLFGFLGSAVGGCAVAAIYAIVRAVS